MTKHVFYKSALKATALSESTADPVDVGLLLGIRQHHPGQQLLEPGFDGIHIVDLPHRTHLNHEIYLEIAYQMNGGVRRIVRHIVQLGLRAKNNHAERTEPPPALPQEASQGLHMAAVLADGIRDVIKLPIPLVEFPLHVLHIAIDSARQVLALKHIDPGLMQQKHILFP